MKYVDSFSCKLPRIATLETFDINAFFHVLRSFIGRSTFSKVNFQQMIMINYNGLTSNNVCHHMYAIKSEGEKS